MNDQQQSRADALTDEHIATLKLAARAVTPQDIDGAERIESRPDGSYITCPACEGEGCIPFESDYCNYDHVAIGVQFYGVGTEPGAAEAYFRAAKPATILALLDRLERAESALAAPPVEQPAAPPIVSAPASDARECLMDVVSHHQDFVTACKSIKGELHACGAHDSAAYWQKQIDVLDRMKAQAERALATSANETGAEGPAIELLRKFMEYRDSDYVPNVLFDCARTIIDNAMAAAALADETPEGCTPADARMLREANHALATENDALRRTLRPFARVVSTDKLSWAMVEYCVEGDPEKQTFQAPQMQRAFNRAADILRAEPSQPAAAPHYEVSGGGEWFAATEAQYNAWSGKKRIATIAAASPAAESATEDHECLYENGDGVCRQCVELAKHRRGAASPVAEEMRDAAMRTVQAMGLVYTPGSDRWRPNAAPQPAQADALGEEAYVAKRMTETLATVYATIIGDDEVDTDDGLNAIERVVRAAQVLRLEVDLYRAQADAQAEAREPIAWVTDDDRAITAAQKQRALADGGATASSVRPYSIPCYAVSAPADAGEARLTDAARDMLAERRRQVEAEGWTPEHDDQYQHGAIALAAACYAANAGGVAWADPLPSFWPWMHNWWKPTTPRRDLVKAGALILAELERLDRAALLNGADHDQ